MGYQDSTTYSKNCSEAFFNYGSGPVSGFFAEDLVNIGGFQLPSFTFAEIENLKGLGQSWCGSGFDGICGMAFGALSDGLPTPMGEMVKRKELKENVFGFYLGYTNSTSEAEPNSELVIGGVDPEHYTGDFVYVPLKADTYWRVTLDSVKVNGESVSGAANEAIIDSGTSLIAGPDDDIKEIMTNLGAQQSEGLWVIQCQDLNDEVSFTMAGHDFTIAGDDLVYMRDNGLCVLGFQGGNPFWILGDVFMRKYYVKFDWCNTQVGIAPSRPLNSTTRTRAPSDTTSIVVLSLVTIRTLRSSFRRLFFGQETCSFLATCTIFCAGVMYF